LTKHIGAHINIQDRLFIEVFNETFEWSSWVYKEYVFNKVMALDPLKKSNIDFEQDARRDFFMRFLTQHSDVEKSLDEGRPYFILDREPVEDPERGIIVSGEKRFYKYISDIFT